MEFTGAGRMAASKRLRLRLRALLAIDPQNKLIEPVTNWLVKNRRGAQWSNTRDTAIVVLTLNDYLRVSGELQPRLSYELLVNGNSDRDETDQRLPMRSARRASLRFDAKLIRDGANEISIVRTSGSGPLYFSAAGKVLQSRRTDQAGRQRDLRARQYFKLVNHPTLLKGYRFRTSAAERWRNGEERRSRRSRDHDRSEEQLRVSAVRRSETGRTGSGQIRSGESSTPMN